MTKTSLGDGVYIEYVNDAILKLTTENGNDTTNTIWLEWDTYDNLITVVTALIAQKNAEAREQEAEITSLRQRLRHTPRKP